MDNLNRNLIIKIMKFNQKYKNSKQKTTIIISYKHVLNNSITEKNLAITNLKNDLKEQNQRNTTLQNNIK